MSVGSSPPPNRVPISVDIRPVSAMAVELEAKMKAVARAEARATTLAAELAELRSSGACGWQWGVESLVGEIEAGEGGDGAGWNSRSMTRPCSSGFSSALCHAPRVLR